MKLRHTLILAAAILFGAGSAIIAQQAQIQVANGSNANPSIYGVTPPNGIYFTTNATKVTTHFGAGNRAANTPALSSCGTSPTLATGSNDVHGVVTQGGSTTGCTITFGTAYTNAPHCVVTNYTAANRAFTTTVTPTTLVIASLTASDVFAYACFSPGS